MTHSDLGEGSSTLLMRSEFVECHTESAARKATRAGTQRRSDAVSGRSDYRIERDSMGEICAPPAKGKRFFRRCLRDIADRLLLVVGDGWFRSSLGTREQREQPSGAKYWPSRSPMANRGRWQHLCVPSWNLAVRRSESRSGNVTIRRSRILPADVARNVQPCGAAATGSFIPAIAPG